MSDDKFNNAAAMKDWLVMQGVDNDIVERTLDDLKKLLTANVPLDRPSLLIHVSREELTKVGIPKSYARYISSKLQVKQKRRVQSGQAAARLRRRRHDNVVVPLEAVERFLSEEKARS